MCDDDAGEAGAGAVDTKTAREISCEVSAVGSEGAPPTCADNDEKELVAFKSGQGDVDGTLAEIEVRTGDKYTGGMRQVYVGRLLQYCPCPAVADDCC